MIKQHEPFGTWRRVYKQLCEWRADAAGGTGDQHALVPECGSRAAEVACELGPAKQQLRRRRLHLATARIRRRAARISTASSLLVSSVSATMCRTLVASHSMAGSRSKSPWSYARPSPRMPAAFDTCAFSTLGNEARNSTR